MATTRDRRVHYSPLVMLLFMPHVLAGDTVRLAGRGSSRCSGRVEVYHNSEMGTVCDDDWDMSDAKVVCRQLSCGAALNATKEAGFGAGSGTIWLDDVICSGNENSLTECGHRGFGSHNCRHTEDAGVICSDGLPIPSVSLSPLEVTWGQSGSVACSITGLSEGTFFLRHSNLDVQRNSSNPATFTLSKVTFENRGPYHCLYKKVFSGQTLQSPQSDSLVFTVKFPKPSISVTPAREVKWGQTGVTVTCTISSQISGGRFMLKHQNGNVLTSSTNTFHLPRVTFDTEGSYHCLYQKNLTDPGDLSPQSDSLTLQVSVTPPVPSLCVASPAEEKCSTDSVHVTKGDSFAFNCSTSANVPEGLFLLWSPGSNSFLSQPSVNRSASFSFPVSQSRHQGQYSCVYQVTGAGRTYTSERAPIDIFIKLPLVLLIAPSVVGVLLVLGLVSLLLFLTLRKRSRGQRSQNTIQAQSLVSQIYNISVDESGNKYHEDSDEDEEDYVNVDAPNCGDTKHVSNPQVGSSAYQAQTNFYPEESAIQVRIVKNSEACFVEENSEDDDDSDAGDYENVTKMNTEEQENIYANL